jgi:hypothetical protein
MRNVTMVVRFTGLVGFHRRLWFASRLIRAAGWLLGCRIVIENRDEDNA